ncbi:MAG: elongation factor P maturation arginine rhamnosyltransferase EarP [Chitinispirillales bacterium]|jgi:uncharacterized repeat protein (TIGR03837 family)|nr:elongation factor P maturation arginine rhamnosyltransferase EarP [Chitinispirillales bacterium]
MPCSSIDIFCHCIDNFGDAGVAYRFAAEFKAANAECRVRVFIDELQVLSEIADEIDAAKDVQVCGGITYVNTLSLDRELIASLGVAEVMVEIFACHIPEPLLEIAYERSRLIINLEYFSAEEWVEGYHLKESLLGRGAVRKFFFMQGVREGTGGIIINSALKKLRDSTGGIDQLKVINDTVSPFGITVSPDDNTLTGTVFTYERGFDTLLADLAALKHPVILLIFGAKSQRGMSATLARLGVNGPYQHSIYKNIRLLYTPFIAQHAYDTLLCCTDFNIVRGEDSLARALLSGKPFIWNAYIQDEKYQRVKVEALLKTMRPFYKNYDNHESYSDLTLRFNDADSESPFQTTGERYADFFNNLKKYERTAVDIYYFMETNCNLIEKFCCFLKGEFL